MPIKVGNCIRLYAIRRFVLRQSKKSFSASLRALHDYPKIRIGVTQRGNFMCGIVRGQAETSNHRGFAIPYLELLWLSCHSGARPESKLNYMMACKTRPQFRNLRAISL